MSVVRLVPAPARGSARPGRVLVLDGNENQAVACVRSLAAAGHEVWVGADSRWSKAGWSRFCTRPFRYPGAQSDAHGFVQRVLEELQAGPPALVLPLTERSTLPLSARRDEVRAAGGRLVLPSHDTVLRTFDKAQTTELARSLGIAVPWTAVVKDYASARKLAVETHYPVVLKPQSSEEIGFSGKTRSTGRPLYAKNPHEFMVAFRTLARRTRAVLVQEFVPGAGVGYFALMSGGEVRAEFAHRRLRDVRPTGSGSSLRMSVLPDSRLRGQSLNLLRELGWHGVAMVEYRMRDDGTPVFLEVNGRFWNSLALAVNAGVDFPRLLAQLAETGTTGPLPAYRPGVRCRWLLGDFRHLLEVFRGAPTGFPGRYPGRLRALADFLRPSLGTHHDNFRLDDPLPELGDWLDFAVRRIPSFATRCRSTRTRKELHVQRRYSHP
jgi:predicted ATP-grasp superfamily ATP-dependent carboligase